MCNCSVKSIYRVSKPVMNKPEQVKTPEQIKAEFARQGITTTAFRRAKSFWSSTAITNAITAGPTKLPWPWASSRQPTMTRLTGEPPHGVRTSTYAPMPIT
jgi:hypothetical protein